MPLQVLGLLLSLPGLQHGAPIFCSLSCGQSLRLKVSLNLSSYSFLKLDREVSTPLRRERATNESNSHNLVCGSRNYKCAHCVSRAPRAIYPQEIRSQVASYKEKLGPMCIFSFKSTKGYISKRKLTTSSLLQGEPWPYVHLVFQENQGLYIHKKVDHL